MTFTQEKSARSPFANITLYARLRDGEICAYIAEADEGYVMYDASDITADSADGEETTERRYHTRAIFPLSTDLEKLNWTAVKRDDIDSKYVI